ncbi:MAG: metallophosphoesterase family protein [Limisphaerales bacterium]
MTRVTVLTAADLHRSANLYGLLAQAVARHRPAIVTLVGDFLDATGETEGKLTTEECAVALAELPCQEIVFIRGNHEDAAWFNFAAHWMEAGREIHLLDGKAFTFGPLVILGFPCLMCQGDGLFDDLPRNPDQWLHQLVRRQGPASRTLWLMHEPPQPSPLAASTGPGSGNVEWRLAIERFMPWLVIFGHDHLTPIRRNRWNHRQGGSLQVNVGQPDEGPLHYAVIEMDFPETQPCLPHKMVVTAYPSRQNVQCPQSPLPA